MPPTSEEQFYRLVWGSGMPAVASELRGVISDTGSAADRALNVILFSPSQWLTRCSEQHSAATREDARG